MLVLIDFRKRNLLDLWDKITESYQENIIF